MGSERMGSRGARVAGGGRGVEGEVEDEVEGEVLCGRGRVEGEGGECEGVVSEGEGGECEGVVSNGEL